MTLKFHISLLLLTKFLFAQINPCQSTVEGWDFQKAFSIENHEDNSSLEDFQVLIELDTETLINHGDMNADGSDIRISGLCDNSNPLDFWFDDINTTSTKIWVKVPNIEPGDSENIYLHYGNLNANSEANGSNVFLFFDDFEEPLNGWTFQGGTWENFQFLGENVLKATDLTTGSGYAALLNTTLAVSDYIVEVEYAAGVDGAMGGPMFEHNDFNNLNSYHLMTGMDVTMISTITNGSPNYSQQQPFPSVPNQWYDWKIIRNGSANTVDIYLDNIFQNSNPTAFSDGVGVWCYGRENSVYYDNIFVRKLSQTEPTVTELIINDAVDPITSLDIDGESGWQLFSSPVEGAILSDLLDELWTQGSINSDLYWGDPNVFTYDEGWNPVMDLNTHVLSAGQGIAVYVFSDTDDDGEDDLPVTIGLDDGFTEYEEAVTISTNESSYNLLGNPYAFSVDIAQLSSDNPNYGSSVYVWDRSISSYRVHNGTTGDIADGLLAPFQGFWVQSNAEGNNYSFSEESISNDQGTNYRTTDNESNGSAVFTFSTGEFSSSVFLSFTPEGEINLDAGDADRFMPISGTEHLTSMIYESTKSLAINNLPLEMNTDITLDMDVMMLEPSDPGYETQQSQVHMSWDMSNLPEGIIVALQNNVTGYMVNLDGYPSMNITLPSKGGFESNSELMETYPEVGESQFTLIITTDFASSDDDELTTANNFKLHSAYPNPFNPSTKIRFDLTEVDMVSMDVFDISGRQVATLINEIMIPGSHEVNWNPGELSSGVYLIKLNAGENSMNQKVTYIK